MSETADAIHEGIHVVTGATTGIGRAIAIALAQDGRNVLAIGRRREALEELERGFSGRITIKAIDLLDDRALRGMADDLIDSQQPLRALIQCAGVYVNGPLTTVQMSDVDAMYQTNVRAPFLLTQRLVDCLERGHGSVIYVNSSAGINESAGEGAGVYAALQHANRVFADIWRKELNSRGIRVLSIYPGRTNTSRTEQIFASEGRSYEPQCLLQPQDIASFVAYTIALPERVEITDVSLRPSRKSY